MENLQCLHPYEDSNSITLHKKNFKVQLRSIDAGKII